MSLHEPIGLRIDLPLVGQPAGVLGGRVARTRAGYGQLTTAALVVYGTLAIVIIANPRPLGAWLDEFEPNWAVDTARSAVDHITAFSDRLGIAGVSDSIRSSFKGSLRRPLGSG